MTKFEARHDGIIEFNENADNIKYHTYEKITEVLNKQLNTIHYLQSQIDELEEESMNIETKALEMIQYYLKQYEETDGLLLCDHNHNAATTLIEFLQVIEKDDLVKHLLRTGEIEMDED